MTPRERHTPRLQGMHRALGVVQDLGTRSVRQPVGERLLAVLVEFGDIDVCRRVTCRGQAHRRDVPRPTTPGADDVNAGRLGRRVLVEPRLDVGGGQDGGVEVEATLGLVGSSVEGLEEAVAQDAELEAVEDLVDLFAVPRRALEVGDRHGQREVTHELVEATVAQDTVEVFAQGLPGLALDLVGVGDHALEVAVETEPLGGRLGSDPGDAREVVARLTDEGGEVAVALGRHEVLLLDGLGVHPPHVGDPAHGIDQRDVVGHELEGVAVTRDDDDLHALGLGHRRQRRDDVVGLEPVDLHVLDPQRIEHLADQRDLPLELARGGGTRGLVVGVLLGAERLARHVERDGDVSGVLVAQHVDEHRREAVDAVGVLTRARREVLHREGEERAIGKGMTVKNKEATHAWQPMANPRHQ